MIGQNQNDNSSGGINGCCGDRNNTWDNAARSCGDGEATSGRCIDYRNRVT